MTEAEWLTCTDPRKMLEFLQGRIDDRHCWRFAAACLGRSLPALDSLPTDDEARRARGVIDLLERVADGTATKSEVESLYPPDTIGFAFGHSICIAMKAADDVVSGMLMVRRFANRTAERRAAARQRVKDAVRATEQTTQTRLLRCILGNPFRAAIINPAWLTWHDGLLVSMVQKMYDGRDFSDMPILADALEEAGCTDPDILEHLRGSGPHVRGCFALDLCLGLR